MNRRMIEKALKRKHEKFLASITDEKLREMIDKDAIITGGSIVSMLLNEKVSDYDYYFKTYSTTLAVAQYYVDLFNRLNPDHTIKPKVLDPDGCRRVDSPLAAARNVGRVRIVVQSAGVTSEAASDQNYSYFEMREEGAGQDYVESIMAEIDGAGQVSPTIASLEEADNRQVELNQDGKPEYRPIFLSANAITLSQHVQLVIRFYGNPEEIHKNYDFIHCCNYWESSTGKLTLNPAALESILARQLIYQGSLYPVCSVIRARKFIRRGWSINAGQYLKMMFQIGELNLKDINVLEDQLTGVDAAYFFEVIDWCKKAKEKDPTFEVTVPYLISIVDKIFG